MQLVVTGYNVKYVCVDVSGALLFLPVGFRLYLGHILLVGVSFYKAGDFVYSVGVSCLELEICTSP
jgi:hypothetical protein